MGFAERGHMGPVYGYRKFKVMGKEFDAAQPDKYIDSFAIRRT
jgi:hypothetical protein